MRLSFKIAKSFLFKNDFFKNGVVNVVSFIGLFIGSLSIILSISVLNGFQNILKDETIKVHGEYLISNYNEVSDLSIIDEIKRNNIEHSIFDNEEFILSNNSSQKLVTIKNILNKNHLKFYKLNLINKGKDLKDNEMIIGKSLARSLNINVGDNVNIFSKNINLNSLALPRSTKFKVVNIYSNRILRIDDYLIFISNNDIINKDNLSLELIGDIENSRILEERSLSWKDRNRQIFEATEVEKKITFFTLSLIIIIASFNLCSAIIQISSKKIREIAILMSIGMSKNSIRNIFILYSYLIGLSAISLGILTSLFIIFMQNRFSIITLNPDYYLVEKLPMVISIFDIFYVFLAAIVIIGIFSIIPLRFINHMSPNQIINKQS